MEKQLFDEMPKDIRSFLVYMETVRGKSPRTVEEYALDLRTFFRFIKRYRGLCAQDAEFEAITVQDVDTALIGSVTLTDIYEYLLYIQRERGNKAAARARKVSCLRTFYKYACDKVGLVKENPTRNLETPKKKRALPKYLSLEESLEVLGTVDGAHKERDYCILTLFLNCGMRLSELVGINLKDVGRESVTVTGKGNKERVIYLNEACKAALASYLAVRQSENVKDRQALFLSRLGTRISPKTVQWIVKKFLAQAGLNGKGYSVHKLRHTAATLMYQQGGVDIRVLKDILGHESLSTTEIYTHLSSTQQQQAMEKSPLAGVHAPPAPKWKAPDTRAERQEATAQEDALQEQARPDAPSDDDREKN